MFMLIILYNNQLHLRIFACRISPRSLGRAPLACSLVGLLSDGLLVTGMNIRKQTGVCLP